MVDTAVDALLRGLVLLGTDKEVAAVLAAGNVEELVKLEHAALAAEVALGTLVEDGLGGVSTKLRAPCPRAQLSILTAMGW